MYGIIDLTRIDTSHEAHNAFSAPSEGASKEEYVAEMRRRFRSDPGARQHILLVGRALALKRWPVWFEGPFADMARNIAIKAWQHDSPASERVSTREKDVA